MSIQEDLSRSMLRFNRHQDQLENKRIVENEFNQALEEERRNKLREIFQKAENSKLDEFSQQQNVHPT
jgi:DNA topoisomerase VI subunit A